MTQQFGVIEQPHALTDLTGQVAFVTGASSGIGARFAQVLAACGAKVALAARRVDRLEQLAAQINDRGGQAMAIPLDLRDSDRIEAAVAEAQAALGPIDILVNNAGINYGKRAVGMGAARFDDEMGTNVRGPWLLARAVGEQMIARQQGGRIVNIASIGAFICSRPGAAVYSISKAAVVRMTEVLAVEWAPHFINVNAIAPGMIASEMTAAFLDNPAVVQGLPRQRICDPAHLDSTLIYLVSPLSQAVTGTVIKVDDGQTPR